MAAVSSLTGINAVCPCARHINPSLVLVQPRKTHPFITGSLLMGRKESNYTNKLNKQTKHARTSLSTYPPTTVPVLIIIGLNRV